MPLGRVNCKSNKCCWQQQILCFQLHPANSSPHRVPKFEANNSSRQCKQNKLKNIKCAELAIFASIPATKLLGGISRSVWTGGCLPGIQLPSSISILTTCAFRSDYSIKGKNNWSSRGKRKGRHLQLMSGASTSHISSMDAEKSDNLHLSENWRNFNTH